MAIHLAELADDGVTDIAAHWDGAGDHLLRDALSAHDPDGTLPDRARWVLPLIADALPAAARAWQDKLGVPNSASMVDVWTRQFSALESPAWMEERAELARASESDGTDCGSHTAARLAAQRVLLRQLSQSLAGDPLLLEEAMVTLTQIAVVEQAVTTHGESQPDAAVDAPLADAATVATGDSIAALSAAIDAARAIEDGADGEVLAREIHALSVATARASDDIAVTLSALQSATNDTVSTYRTVLSASDAVNACVARLRQSLIDQARALDALAHSDASDTCMLPSSSAQADEIDALRAEVAALRDQVTARDVA